MSTEIEKQLPAPDGAGVVKRVGDIRAGYFVLDAALRSLAESSKDRAHDPDVAQDIRRTYLSGALLSIGDMLADADYLDRSPEFEFVRHIRNAVAHGNVFEFKDYHLEGLEKYPAYLVSPDGSKSHAIKEKVHGRECLFGFLGPTQVLEAMDAAAKRIDEISIG